MQKRLWQVLTSVKEHSSVGYAKMATSVGLCDLDLIVVKATCPDDLPLSDRYVLQLLKIFSISPSSSQAFSLSFARRFGRTHCWRVALKCLVLLHRLLRSLPPHTPFRAELLWARYNGWTSLYPCRFRDASSSASQDYTAFIRSYAQLLDETLDCFSIEDQLENNSNKEDREDVAKSLADKMKEVDRMLVVLPQLQSLMERVMDCRPVGAAARSFLVQSAMKHIIRDSFACYTAFRGDLVVVLDDLMRMPYRNSVAALGIYKKAALQADKLSEFYDWCKSMGLCGLYEYPFVDRIPEIQVRALETFLNGMWQLTESSSSTASPITSTSSVSEDDSDHSHNKQVVTSKIAASGDDEEHEPLIQLEVKDNVSWEALLEASISHSCLPPRNLTFNGYEGYEYLCGSEEFEYQWGSRASEWQTHVYNPHALNPFCQPHKYMAHHYSSCPCRPANPRAL